MSTWFALLAVLVVPVLSAPWEHMLLLWEDRDYKGESSYVLIRDHSCVSLISKWRNRVSSLNTNRHCFQLYEGTNCDGKEVYVYPMSKHHNDLTALGINDRVNSVRYCVLDEDAMGPSNKEKFEYPFWDYVLGKISVSYQNAYRGLSKKYNYSNPWHFIPNIRSSSPVAEQYQAALDWFVNGVNIRNFSLADLRHARKLSYTVFDNRANLNAERKNILGTREDAVTFQLEVYWKMVVEVIDTEIDRKLDEEENAEERRLRKRNEQGRIVTTAKPAINCGIMCRLVRHLVHD